MSALTVSIVQSELQWHDAAANRRHFAQVADSIEVDTDLIVLPEMFTTGFSMDAKSLAEPMDGPTLAWMQELATRKNASVCGSVIIEDGGNYFNRFLSVSAGGIQVIYDKRHLFRLADEQHHYSAGTEKTYFDLNGFRICPLVCYDLRFPVWSRNQDNYDLLLFVANWPSRRQFAWDTLLRARAIENLSYVAAVNRIGTDGNDLPYTGGSSIVDYLGADLANLGDQPGVATATLDLAAMQSFREHFAFQKDADNFNLG